jgi:alkylation response protein AidB-like acyl-CoA dehydrogenase
MSTADSSTDFAAAVAEAADIEGVLGAARALGATVGLPGADTLSRWRTLAGIAEQDVSAARMIEPHLDALAILAEADLAEARLPGATAQRSWAVFAAEGPGLRLRAEPEGSAWRLTGVKPWCSLAGSVSHALVTAWVDDERRGLFAVQMDAAGIRVSDPGWHARGLAAIVSAPVGFEAVPATAVGEPGWYLRRVGFAWGGIGVAACWWGGARPLLRRLVDRAATDADALNRARIGTAIRGMQTAAIDLVAAARDIDSGPARSREQESARAHRIRGNVVDAVTLVLDGCRDVLGPAPSAFDEEYARRVADLTMYIAQYHRGRDDASLAARSTPTALPALTETGW